MKKVIYELEDMQTLARLLNEISIRGLSLEQAKCLAAAAGIIDGGTQENDEYGENSMDGKEEFGK